MTDPIWSQLRRVISEFFEDGEIQLSEGTVAADVDGWDSLANVELMIEVERKFGIRFRTGELAELESVGALVRLIRHHLEKSGR